MPETKQCTVCGEAKILDDFYPRSDEYGLQSACKPCKVDRTRRWRESNREKSAALVHKSKLKTTYGMTVDEYDFMLKQQGGVCAICEKPETARHQGGKIRRLGVDHCHSTGRVRKLLCIHCNLLLGYIEKSRAPLRSVLAYLAEFKVDHESATTA